LATKCPKCHSDNPESVKFCGECGTQLIPADGPQVSKTLTLETKAEGLTRGTVFAGRYEILEDLGGGGMGKVYRVYDRELEEDVALKLIRPEIAADRKAIERFKNELKVTRKITHKSVCKMYDLGESEGVWYITMEYVRGEDLQSFIRRSKRLTVGTSMAIARQVAEGLAEAHRLGVVHRDLKPSNIMIDKEGEARIMDFGIARSIAAGGLTGEGIIIGTPEYMSPEQVDGKAADHRSDIYSLGIVLYEMVTGRPPFRGDSAMSVALKHKTEMPPDPLQLNPQMASDLGRIILKCLQKDPAARYQTAQEFLSDLGLLQKGQAPGPRTAPLPSPRAEGRAGIKEKAARSIAVLPFTDLSPEKDQGYFCDGIAEEIINSLTKIKDLSVVARTSAFFFKDTNMDIREIGRRLDVETILEGSVRKAGTRLRITAQLVDVGTGYHLWSERYDRSLEDIFAIQDEVTAAIIENLRLSLLAHEKEAVLRRSTNNLEAHNLYLKGTHFLGMFAGRRLDLTIDYFCQALEKDPGYAAAYCGLAVAYVSSAFFGDQLPGEQCQKAKTYARKALELDPTVGDAHGVLSYVYTTHDWNWEAADRESLEALRLSPGSSLCHLYRSFYLTQVERHDEAVAETFEALRLDPVSSIINSFVGVALIWKGEFGRAIDELETAKKLLPDIYVLRSFLGIAYYANGEYEKAVEEHRKATELSGGASFPSVFLELALSQCGKREEADRLFEELKKRSEKEYVTPAGLFLMHLERGHLAEAFQWLRKGGEMHDTNLSWTRVAPREMLKSPNEPRLINLVKKGFVKAMITRTISRFRITEDAEENTGA
jgi:serine/threonine protein kinase/tetratricopeptide (TPR) repeat protein